MKYRIASLILAVFFLMSAAVPAMASEVVETKYNYTPLPGFYSFYIGSVNVQSGSISLSGGADFTYTLSNITETTNTHYKIQLNAESNGQYDYLSFVVFCDSDNIDSVSAYLNDGYTSYASNCEYSIVSGSELSGTIGSYAVTVLVDCSGFSGDVYVEISGHLGEGGNGFFVAITGYSVSSYSGVLVDYWDDTLELLRQILGELQEGNGLLSDIKASLAGFRSDLVYWTQEIYSAIQLNFLTLSNFLSDFKSSVETAFSKLNKSVDDFWADTVYWFEETFAAIQLGFLNVVNTINTWGENIRAAIVGEHYTQDDEFSEDADSVVEENENLVDQIEQNTPTIPLDDINPSDFITDNGGGFSAGTTLGYFFDGVLLFTSSISLMFALLGYALFGKR